jgi:hypothetical protein
LTKVKGATTRWCAAMARRSLTCGCCSAIDVTAERSTFDHVDRADLGSVAPVIQLDSAGTTGIALQPTRSSTSVATQSVWIDPDRAAITPMALQRTR